MQKTGNKTRLYFKSKYCNKLFSSEIFDKKDNNNLHIRFLTNLNDNEVEVKTYNNIYEILNDENFTICTDNSFTEKELIAIRQLICARCSGIYDNETLVHILYKIETMLMSGTYLPDDENEIIRK